MKNAFFHLRLVILLFLFICGLTLGYWYGVFLRVRIDPKLLEEMVNKSQWVIPLSPWKISDEVLYLQSGVKYVSGWLSWQINPETPPLAKLGYGVSQTFLQNPYFFTFFSMLIFLFLCVKLLQLILREKLARLLAFILLVSSPIIFMQLGYTMLELPMGVFFLLFLYSLFRKRDDISIPTWLSAGLGLGFLAACKFPLYPAFLAFVVSLWLFKKSKKSLSIFSISAGLAYLTAYLPFFIRGMSLFDWAKNQWWMIRFYQQGVHQNDFFKSLFGLSTGFFTDETALKLLQEWSLLWPILIVGNILFWIRKAKLSGLQAFSLPDWLGAGSLAFVLLTPFQARYFFLPFLLLFFNAWTYVNQIKVSSQRFRMFSVVALAIAISGMLRVYARGPVEEASYLRGWWQTKNYRDIDVLLSSNPWGSTSVIEDITRKVDTLATIQTRDIIFQDSPPLFTFDNSWTGLASVKLTTAQGSTLGEIRPIVFHREGLRWVLDWDSGMAFPGYKKNCAFEAVENDTVSLFQNWKGFIDFDRRLFQDLFDLRDIKGFSLLSSFTGIEPITLFHTLTLENHDQTYVRFVVKNYSSSFGKLEAQELKGMNYTSIFQNSDPMWRRTALGRKVICPPPEDE